VGFKSGKKELEHRCTAEIEKPGAWLCRGRGGRKLSSPARLKKLEHQKEGEKKGQKTRRQQDAPPPVKRRQLGMKQVGALATIRRR